MKRPLNILEDDSGIFISLQRGKIEEISLWRLQRVYYVRNNARIFYVH